MSASLTSPLVLSICAQHWQADARGNPRPNCCHGCPLKVACYAAYPTLEDRRGAMDAAAGEVAA